MLGVWEFLTVKKKTGLQNINNFVIIQYSINLFLLDFFNI